jgi:hypothetical protein
MFTKPFWVATLERTVRQVAGTLLTTWLVLSDTGPLNAFELDWEKGAGIAVGAAIVSVLMSLGATAVSSGPSFTPKAEVDSALAPLVEQQDAEALRAANPKPPDHA